MTGKKLKNLVTEAVSLDREINAKSERLKQLKATLVEVARTHDHEHLPTGGGGLRWTVEGNDGCIARVNFPAPSLKSKVEADDSALEKIKKAAGGFFERLFVPTHLFKPVANFRDEASSLLSEAEAKKLIKLCEHGSAPRVSFETTDRSETAENLA